MKKISLLTSIASAVALMSTSSVLMSCSKYWDSHFDELSTSDKIIEVTLPKTSCVYTLILKEKLQAGQYISPAIETTGLSSSEIKLKIDEIAGITNKAVYFTVTMENLPSTGSDKYWAKFDLVLTCKNADNSVAWTSNKLSGFKLTVKKA